LVAQPGFYLTKWPSVAIVGSAVQAGEPMTAHVLVAQLGRSLDFNRGIGLRLSNVSRDRKSVREVR